MTHTFSDRIEKLRAALRYDSPLHVTDVGANPMKHDAPYKDLLDRGDIVVTGFDPQAETLQSLESKGGTSHQYLPYAVGDGKAHNLNIYRGSGLTSLLTIRRSTLFFLMGLKKAAKLLATERFETKRLDDIGEIRQIDLLKIDIQGAEKLVFEHGQKTMASAVAVHSEVNFFPLYENQPSFGDIDVALRQLGFVPHSFYHTVKRLVRSKYLWSLDKVAPSQLLDGDIIYFRDLSNASALTNDQLRKMALIADGIYNFHDYALRCLDELEGRGETDEKSVQAYVAAVNNQA